MVWQWGLMLLVALGGRQDNVLTMDEAVQIATQNAFSVRLANSNVLKSRQTENTTQGALGPAVTVNGTYSRSENIGGQANQGGQGSGGFDSKSVAISVSQLVDITGLSRKAVRAARLATMAQEAGVLAEVNTLRGATRTKYYAVLQRKELVLVREAALKSATDRLEKANIRLTQGAIPRFDVLRFESEKRKAEKDLVDAKSFLRLAKQDLNNTMGRPIETEFDVTRPDVEPASPGEASDVVAMALENRPEVLRSKYTVESLTIVRMVQSAGNKPSLRVSASHTRNIDPGIGQSQASTVGSAVVSWPVFDSGITKARVEAARQDEEQAKIQLEQVQLAIALEVRNALEQLQSAKEALDLAKKNEEVAKEALRLADLRYNEGAGILLDVTVAQAEYTAAQTAVVNAEFDVRAAYAALQKAVGRDVVTPNPVTEIK